MKVIGKPRRRVDGRAKVTGQTRFADDIVLPRMLHMKLLRSPHAHALIEEMDTEKAKQHPGVHLVLTGKDFPVTFGILPVTQDEYPLAPEHVRYVGDPLAAVVARDEQTATQALDLIEIDSGMIAIVVGESDVAEPALSRAVHPRLQKRLRVGGRAMTLLMRVVIGEKTRAHGAVRNFCRTRSSGYFGKKASTMKTLFGVRSRVGMV